MIVAGIGAGLVNVPLASTAVGVVEPARAGMASGINSTARQIGIATGVAALGSILASQAGERGGLPAQRQPARDRRPRCSPVGQQRQHPPGVAAVPANLRGLAAAAAKSSFIDGLNTIILIGAVSRLPPRHSP